MPEYFGANTVFESRIAASPNAQSVEVNASSIPRGRYKVLR
jgi:hypothetical protein